MERMNVDSLKKLRKRALSWGFVFESLTDRAGVQGISLSLHNDDGSLDHHLLFFVDVEDSFFSEIFTTKEEVTCFDMRSARDLGIDANDVDLIDVSLLYGNDDLMRLANEELSEEEVTEYETNRRRFDSHVRACVTARIDLTEHSLHDIIPSKMMVSYYRLRNEMTWELRKKASMESVLRFTSVTKKRARALYEMESLGIGVDASIDVESVSDRSFMEGLKTRKHHGYITTKFLLGGSRTGRIKVARGAFNCMAIPKTKVRRSIVSRYRDQGHIGVVDMNAADFRCIVAATKDDDLIGLYDGHDDFHARTVELVFGNSDMMDVRRPVVKQVTHLTNYGASIERLHRATKLSTSMLENLLEKMRFLTEPVEEYRTRLYEESVRLGSVLTPVGTEVELTGEEHAGKVLALFAQSCCNDVFMDGVVSVVEMTRGTGTMPIFTVHDELVLDVSELGDLVDVKRVFEDGTSDVFGIPFVARVTVGKNYWDQEDYDVYTDGV
jgi:DNA polymerase I-like protein with 3'-5' exonuclease and polymerase domains